MPRIRILQSVAGLDFSWAPGEVIEVDDKTAKAWADGERAELLEEERTPTKGAARSRGGGRSAPTETR